MYTTYTTKQRNTDTRNARVVFDIDGEQQLEIPFETFSRAFESKIRKNERMRIEKQRERDKKRNVQMIVAFLKYMWQRAIGIAMIVGTIIMINSNIFDGTIFRCINWIIAGFTIPVGIYLTYTKRFVFKK